MLEWIWTMTFINSTRWWWNCETKEAKTYLFRLFGPSFSCAHSCCTWTGAKLLIHVTSPPNENRTTGGDADSGYLGIGVCGLDDWRIIDICTGDAGRLWLLKRLTSRADKLLWRWILNRDGGSINLFGSNGTSVLTNCECPNRSSWASPGNMYHRRRSSVSFFNLRFRFSDGVARIAILRDRLKRLRAVCKQSA